MDLSLAFAALDLAFPNCGLALPPRNALQRFSHVLVREGKLQHLCSTFGIAHCLSRSSGFLGSHQKSPYPLPQTFRVE